MEIEINNIDNDNDIEIESNDETNNNKSLFLYLSNECLSHICVYLNKETIQSFKLISRQICIVCLEEIGILDINNPFNNTKQIDLNNLSHLSECFNMNRHCKTKRCYSLFDEWSLKYNIPENYQLIFELESNSDELSLIDAQTIRLTQIPNVSLNYLIFDKRNIIIWN